MAEFRHPPDADRDLVEVVKAIVGPLRHSVRSNAKFRITRYLDAAGDVVWHMANLAVTGAPPYVVICIGSGDFRFPWHDLQEIRHGVDGKVLWKRSPEDYRRYMATKLARALGYKDSNDPPF